MLNIEGELTIVGDSNGTIKARSVETTTTGILTLESGTIACIDDGGGAAVWNEGEFTMTGGTLKCTGNKNGNSGPVPLSQSE